MARRKMDESLKKKKLTLSVKQETIDWLNDYCYANGMSISQWLDNVAAESLAAAEKEKLKAERKAKKEAKEREQIPGQTELPTFNPVFEELLYRD